MEKFNNRTTRGLSYLLIYLTAIQPLHPAFAALTPDGPRTQVNNAGAVPVINIATPNAAGVSHNTYKDFSVGTPGAVLNNSIAAGQSQLAGQLNANANLNGKAADLIINEVTGSTRSDLQGKIEVFGNKANVLIANPNGITCDGCGFINTPSATLTTGKPVLDQQGALEALEVKKGSITIGGKGLDGSATDYVDILSRATELNGKINAKNLTLTQGSNRVDFKTGTIAPITGEGAKPLLAVDTKALGGMYAERIRLVATEDGVGANVANLTSTQQGITLDSKGKIQLGNVQAKTDLNLNAQQVDIAAGNTVKSDRDITLASTVLNNRGNIIAGEDMRLFNDSLTNTQATIQANNNLWIQKDATGNKGVKVENRSGTIKTNTGDLVIRTEQLDNVRDVFTTRELKLTPNSENIEYLDIFAFKPIFNDGKKQWFDSASVLGFHIQTKNEVIIEEIENISHPSRINSGKNLYINSSILKNKLSTISSEKNAFLTGDKLLSESYSIGTTNRYTSYKGDAGKIAEGFTNGLIYSIMNNGASLGIVSSPVNEEDSFYFWKENGENSIFAKIEAKEDVIIDFNEKINISDSKKNQENKNTLIKNSEIKKTNIEGKNITITSSDIDINGKLNSHNSINIISSNKINLTNSELKSGGDINLTASNGILIDQITSSSGGGTFLTSRTGDLIIKSSGDIDFTNDGDNKLLSNIISNNEVYISGRNITLQDTGISKSGGVSLHASDSVTITESNFYLKNWPYNENLFNLLKEGKVDKIASPFTPLDISSSKDITINAGKGILLHGASIVTNKNININSGEDTKITLREEIEKIDKPTWGIYTDKKDRIAKITAQESILINSGRNFSSQAAVISAKNGNISIIAGSNVILPEFTYESVDIENDNNKSINNHVSTFQSGKNLTIAANNEIIANGSHLSSGGDMVLSSGIKTSFNAIENRIYREGNNEYSESVTQKNAVLNSSGILTLLSNGSILFQATQLIAKGALDAAAKGGFLYAQAAEESSHYEKTTTKRKWYGKKTTIRQTSHNVTNKVTEFTAGGDINLLSRDDSTYEASKINAGKNAKLTSTQGNINFKAVKDTAFEQTITTSKGFFIKSNDKGYTKDTWLLPSIHSGGQLTLDAATGITADAKTQNAQSLQNALLVLSNNPGTAWLKDLNSRTDVQWNTVQDAYSTWNHTTQSLNPVVGAVIAIAVAAVTAGAGLAAAAGNMAVGAVGTGASATTIAVVNGAAYSGMTALTSQAAVALVDNKGNLSKTFQAMSSSDSVKSLVTSMVIGGALAGFDEVMQFSKAANGTTVIDPAKAKLPMLSNGDWSKVAQRVAGQSVISSSIGTAINGGSFKDNFTTALLSNIGSQINAEGAKFIGDKGEVLGLPIDDPRRVISHAVIAGVAAEIGGGNAKGAAAGALAAELAAISLGNTFVDPALREIQITSTGRIIGALAGAAITGKASGVNSGASAAESVLLYNFLMHEEPKILAEKYAACKDSGCESNVRKEMNQISVKNQEIFEGCRAAGNTTCINDMLYGISTASGYNELEKQIGFDLSNQFRDMGLNAYERFNSCGMDISYSCGLTLFAKDAAGELAGYALFGLAGKYLSPVIKGYISEIGSLSSRGSLPNIKSLQVGLREPHQIDFIKNDMQNGKYLYSDPKGIIAGFVDNNGRYYISEGNHRMAAALELYKETGDATFVNSLLKNGVWTKTNTVPADARPMPKRK